MKTRRERVKETDEKTTKQVDGKGGPRELCRLDTPLQGELDEITQRAAYTPGKEYKKKRFHARYKAKRKV